MSGVLASVRFGGRHRLPMILQSEAAECGLASLAMIAGFFGRNSELGDLRRHFGLSLKGATLEDLIRIGDGMGMASRAVRLELSELSLLKLPCILHWDLNHFVVLKSISRKTIVIHDPAHGARKLPMDQVSRHFTGVALELTPTGGFEARPAAPRIHLRALVGNMVGLKRSLVYLLVLAFAIEIFAMVSPLFLTWVVDHTLITADYDLLITLVLAFSLLLLIRNAVLWMRGWFLAVLGASLQVQAKTNLFSHLVNLPTSYFESRHLGDVMSRFRSQDTILKTITTELVEAVLDGLMASITLIVIFALSPALGAIVLAGAVAYGVLRWGLYVPLREASMEAIVWGARQDSNFLETLRGIRTIKLFNGLERRRSRWLNLTVEMVNRQLTVKKLQLAFRVSNSLLLGGLTILVVWLGAQRVIDNSFSLGLLIAFLAYKDQFLSRISELIDKAVDLRMLRLHIERLADIVLTKPETRMHVPLQVADRAPAAIEVRNLRFRYNPNDPYVLDGVNFRVEAGESVAIVGTSGGGKTTLLKILASLLQPEQGEVLIDGEPLKRIGTERYRGMIGVVMQDDDLFAGSIADNICFFADRSDSARIVECARLAAIHDDILAMPMGYGTLIGDMGTTLSGGQKQRVLLARALYHRPSILLLDEATSHLDVATESLVNAAIRNSSITRIVIAHRPETIRSSDRVIGINRGRVSKDLQLLTDAGSSREREPAAGMDLERGRP
jgi:ATP-binding cassette, subfamily B, bacterial CvaB/MchF/RaxB